MFAPAKVTESHANRFIRGSQDAIYWFSVLNFIFSISARFDKKIAITQFGVRTDRDKRFAKAEALCYEKDRKKGFFLLYTCRVHCKKRFGS